jgi:hypothetical protein
VQTGFPYNYPCSRITCHRTCRRRSARGSRRRSDDRRASTGLSCGAVGTFRKGLRYVTHGRKGGRRGARQSRGDLEGGSPAQGHFGWSRWARKRAVWEAAARLAGRLPAPAPRSRWRLCNGAHAPATWVVEEGKRGRGEEGLGDPLPPRRQKNNSQNPRHGSASSGLGGPPSAGVARGCSSSLETMRLARRVPVLLAAAGTPLRCGV